MSLGRYKLRHERQCRLVECFVLEVNARLAASVLGIRPTSIASFYRKLRQLIANQRAPVEHEVIEGAIKLDESYFGGVRKGKRGRGAPGKAVVLGLIKRGGKVCAKVVDIARTATLMPVMQRKSLQTVPSTPTALAVAMC